MFTIHTLVNITRVQLVNAMGAVSNRANRPLSQSKWAIQKRNWLASGGIPKKRFNKYDWVLKQRARGICYLCKNKIDDDAGIAHVECNKLKHKGLTVKEIRDHVNNRTD